MEVADVLSSSRRLCSCSFCVVKFVNCSTAFLLTCENFLSASLTLRRFLAS